MRFGDYAEPASAAGFAEYNARLVQRDSADLVGSVGPAQLAALRALEVSAVAGAHSARGRFPLVMLLGGLNAATTASVGLAEFLASYGYVVATVPGVGPSDDQFDASRSPVSLETMTRDVEFAWSRLRVDRTVDPTRFAVAGHSLGGVVAVLVGMRNRDVNAVVGLDGTYGFSEAGSVLSGFYSYAASMPAALLDLRRAAGEQGLGPGDVDLRAVHALRHSERAFVTLRNIRHTDLTTFALVAAAFNVAPPTGAVTPGWTRATAAIRYMQACRMVRDFLDAQVKDDTAGMSRLAADVAASPGAALVREAALPVPPTPPELVALARDSGFAAATRMVEAYARQAPVDGLVNPEAFNELGYSLLGQRRTSEALLAFRLTAFAHPHSANAFDSLGDGYLAAGQIAEARDAFARALALEPFDSTLDPASRVALRHDTGAKLQQLRSGPTR